jgi:8-oxo-dGTP diphosphatase
MENVYNNGMPSPAPKHLRFAVVAVDAACLKVDHGKLSVLVGRVNTKPHYVNRWGLIGGLILPNENADEAITRHLATKAGVKRIYKEQLYAFSDVDRDPRGRVISVAYLCLADDTIAGGGEAQAKWMPVKDVPKLAYDHDLVLRTAVERLRARIGYTNIAQHLLPREFTLTNLQNTYEAVLGHKLDKRNFRKKVQEVKLVTGTGKKEHKGASRPAELYRFSSKETKTIEIL